MSADALLAPGSDTRAPSSDQPARDGSAHADQIAPVPGRSWERLAVIGLLAATAVLYLWGLSVSGWANAFYSAAAQAGAESWKAFFFGSSDWANSITVDKPPASLWVMGLSVRVFGLSSWSILVPEALMGVATVGLLYGTVRRATRSPVAGLIAGAALAVTPVAVLMFRFNNPDALLVMLMVAAAAAVQRALDSPRAVRWMVLAGTLIGFAFLTKMLQAFLVLPAFALVYAVEARVGFRKRILHLLAAFGATVVSAGWYVAIVELWPASSRPYIGGSQHNSLLELTLGYNGLGRITGNETGSVGGGGRPGGGSMWGQTGLGRMFNTEMGGQIAWLLPAALILLVAGLWVTRRRVDSDRSRAALLLWGGWLLVTGLTFSYMAGIFHAYYTVALAPAIAAVVGIGSVSLWRHRGSALAGAALAGAVGVTAIWSFVLLNRTADFLPWLRTPLLVLGLVAAGALAAGRRLGRTALGVVAPLALLTSLAGPAAYAVQTVSTAHTGSLPTAGPASGLGPGGGAFGSRGARPVGSPAFGHPGPNALGGVPPLANGGKTPPPPGFAQRALGGPGGFGGGPAGGLLRASTPSAQLVSVLAQDASSYTWIAAAIGSQVASGYQLSAGYPVMPIGGFNGSDPSPTLAQFQSYVAHGRIHWFIAGVFGGPGNASSSSSEIASWVESHFTATTVGAVTLYDLSGGAS